MNTHKILGTWAHLVVAVVLIATLGGCITWPSWIPPWTPPPVVEEPSAEFEQVQIGTPIDLGAWGGRPCVALSPRGTVHIASDGITSPYMATWDLRGAAITAGLLNATTYNPRTVQYFNPSTVILADGTQLLCAWVFAFEVAEGCRPYVLWRRRVDALTMGPWQKLDVDPSPIDWEPCALSAWGPQGAVFWGFNNDYFTLLMDTPPGGGPLVLTPEAHLNFESGGGGEKESRVINSWGDIHVANAGCARTGGAKYRNSGDCPQPRVWMRYSAAPLMGSDDRGHPGVVGDAFERNTGYMCASWDHGLVYNIWRGGGFVLPVDSPTVVDPHGWAGVHKFPFSMAPRHLPGGGAFVVYTRGSHGICVARLRPNGAFDTKSICDGTIGAMCTDAHGFMHLVYNSAGRIWYRKELQW